jgi:hypothetical protein
LHPQHQLESADITRAAAAAESAGLLVEQPQAAQAAAARVQLVQGFPELLIRVLAAGVLVKVASRAAAAVQGLLL